MYSLYSGRLLDEKKFSLQKEIQNSVSFIFTEYQGLFVFALNFDKRAKLPQLSRIVYAEKKREQL